MRRFAILALSVCLRLGVSGSAVGESPGSGAVAAGFSGEGARLREPIPAAAGAFAGLACAIENVPAATLLVPYFSVSRNGTQGEDIPEGGADTLVSFTNTGGTAVITHVTVWNKYGRPVLGFNVPMFGSDVAFFRMKDVLNGKLNVNPLTQNPARLPSDLCGLNRSTGVYAPTAGFGEATPVRFANPTAGDAARSISTYDVPAFSLAQRQALRDSLDESGDVIELLRPQANVLDRDNPLCGRGSEPDGRLDGDFSGYLTVDVVNYCTSFLPDQNSYYTRDAIATKGWEEKGWTPNVLTGDVFYVDREARTATSGSMVSLGYDSSLAWPDRQTFYGVHSFFETQVGTEAPSAYRFAGDGRLPLGTRYGLRFLSDSAQALRSWMVVWRHDRYPLDGGFATDLCNWWASCAGNTGGGCVGGAAAPGRALVVKTWDNDGGHFVTAGGYPGPEPSLPSTYAFLESQRVDLLNNLGINPAGFKGGWIDIQFPGTPDVGQAFVGVQHQGPGISVGMSGTRLDAPYRCSPMIVAPAAPRD